MIITTQQDRTTHQQYYLAEQREGGRLILAEGTTKIEAMRQCAAIVFKRRNKGAAF